MCGLLSGCGVRASHCSGFSRCGAQALVAWASVVAAHGLSSCGAQVQLALSMWHLPSPGIEPMSPALADRLLTTGPPGKYKDFIQYSLLGP